MNQTGTGIIAKSGLGVRQTCGRIPWLTDSMNWANFNSLKLSLIICKMDLNNNLLTPGEKIYESGPSSSLQRNSVCLSLTGLQEEGDPQWVVSIRLYNTFFDTLSP